jgi:hypothetical protein
VTYINWAKEVFIDPVTFSASAGPGGIPIPTYGNYGGPDYADGVVGAAIPPTGALPPVDQLDALFYTHDLAYQLQPSANEIPSADLALIHGIESLTATGSLDAEASLYAGATILGVISLMALNGNLSSPLELAVADATAAYDIEYGLSHLSPTEQGLAEAAVPEIVAAFLKPSSQLPQQEQNLFSLFATTGLQDLVSIYGGKLADSIPAAAVAVEGSMYGTVGTSAEISKLIIQFLPPQVEHAIQNGFNPQVYASESLGLAFAFGNENGGVAFATNFGPSNAAMPNSIAGDAAFAAATASTIFGSAETANTPGAIQEFVHNWKALYSSDGVPGMPNATADQIDLAARGAAWGDAVGIALANNLGPLPGQVTNFLNDIVHGNAVYSAPLASEPIVASTSQVQLTGIAALIDHILM